MPVELCVTSVGTPHVVGSQAHVAFDAHRLPQPFPTMYWLSCPALKAAVSQLENQGLVTEWERRLQVSRRPVLP